VTLVRTWYRSVHRTRYAWYAALEGVPAVPPVDSGEESQRPASPVTDPEADGIDGEFDPDDLAEWRRRLERTCPGCGCRSIVSGFCRVCGASKGAATCASVAPDSLPHEGAHGCFSRAIRGGHTGSQSQFSEDFELPGVGSVQAPRPGGSKRRNGAPAGRLGRSGVWARGCPATRPLPPGAGRGRHGSPSDRGGGITQTSRLAGAGLLGPSDPTRGRHGAGAGHASPPERGRHSLCGRWRVARVRTADGPMAVRQHRRVYESPASRSRGGKERELR
jgi:hypothetical protein